MISMSLTELAVLAAVLLAVIVGLFVDGRRDKVSAILAVLLALGTGALAVLAFGGHFLR